LREDDPARIGPYRLTARLGEGGMGVVYLAESDDGDPVAVKVLRPELIGDAELRARFGREVETLQRIQGVCTVRVVDADTGGRKPFLVTEYVDGPSLTEYTGLHGPLDPEMLYGLATGLAEALTAIHAAGVAHRDLKPSNVLLAADGPKVIDFGIAQVMDATALTKTGMTVGSAGFMAPEQIRGRAGTAADVFAWAVTVGYAATGESPFGSGTSHAIMYRILHEQPDIGAIPPLLRPMVAAALDKEPVARPSAVELLAQLTSAPTRPDRGVVLDTQTVLLRTWRPVSASREIPILPAAAGRPEGTRNKGRSRRKTRRTLLRPLVLSIAVLAAAGVAVGFTLTGRSAPDSARPVTTLQATAVPAPHHKLTPAPHPEASRSKPHSTKTKVSPTRPAQAGSAVTAAASTASASLAAPAPSAPGLPELLAGGYSGRDPSQITFAADNSNTVTGITWSTWSATGATGSGRADLALCLPSCVGTPASVVPATLTLSDPVDGHFTQLTEVRAGSSQTWNYPGTWPQSAS
jgi:serine/threonine protein kinase